MYSILILIYLILFSFFAFRRPKGALYLIVAFLPSYLIRFEIYNLPFTLLEAMILILFLVFILKNKFTWLADFRKNTFFWPIVSVLFFATISIFTSPNNIGALGIWKAYFVEPILFFVVFTSLIKTKKELQNIFWALGVSALYLSLFSFWQYFSAWGVPKAFLKLDGSVDRVVSIFGYPNALGLYLAPIIILFTGFIAWGEKNLFKTGLKLAVIIFSFATIVLAQSEAAILSVLTVWLIWLIINKKTRWWALIFAVIFVIVAMLSDPLKNYLLSKILLQDYSGFIRRLIWQESWTMLKDNWLWGAGLAGYQTKIAPYHLPTFEIFLYPHNIILNFWSELGILGLISFVWLGVKFFAVNINNFLTNQNKILALTLVLVGVQLIIQGLVDAPYFKNDLSVLFWLIVGLSQIKVKS